MIVVSDTSSLTALLQVGRADLLQRLYGRVFIPTAVVNELRMQHDELPNWLEVVAPRSIPLAVSLADLDAGETEALALALELRADAVLIDERLGRQIATSLGLLPTGVLGVLVLAKRRGHLSAVGPVIRDLQLHAGCWFSAPLIAEVLRVAGETSL